jgi:hypothetical protein
MAPSLFSSSFASSLEAPFPSSPPLHLPQSKLTYQSLNHPKTRQQKPRTEEREKKKKKTKEKKMPKQNKSPASIASLPRANKKVKRTNVRHLCSL